VARSNVSVMLLGETGTGKEVVARVVHTLSSRRGELVAVNCGAFPPHLVESELFGHKRGAFSGATEDRLGLVRSADGGTLFLDEIGELPASAQAALLRVLQESEVVPVGATRPIRVNVRLVTATHRDLSALVDAGSFRKDLLARISGFKLALPPLRDRKEDVGLLVGTLLPRVLPEHFAQTTFCVDAARALFRYDWPLNVRELEKALGVAAVLARGGRIELEHLPAEVRQPPRAPTPLARLSPEELAHQADLVELLTRHRGNVAAVARDLKKGRQQVHRWMKRYGVDPNSFRP
jgi:transcriptional regulator with GAF, ATPase, and Fis domain